MDKQNPDRQFTVAYIVSRFPKVTETFVLYEILAVEQQGVRVELYPLMRERTDVIHPEARPLVARAHYLPFISLPILISNAHYMLKKPRTYWDTLWTALRATWRSKRFLAGIVAFFPKAVHMARLMSEADIMHIHAHFASHPAAVAYVIHRLSGIPYSFTAHGSDLHRDRRMLKEKVADADKVVAISQYNKQVIMDECGDHVEGKVAIVHCGVNLDSFQVQMEQDPQDRFTILCIGSLHEVKGQKYLIEACQLLREREVDFTCQFIGDGPDREILAAQTARAGLTDHIHFHGQLPHSEVAALLKQAHVVALPSVPSSDGRREGIPVALMEAMASGLAVVSSRLSGIPELVEDGEAGFLTEPGDVAGIADALETLYRKPALRRKFGQAGREKILREFELNANAERLVKVFHGRETAT